MITYESIFTIENRNYKQNRRINYRDKCKICYKFSQREIEVP